MRRLDPDRQTAAMWVGALRPAVVSHWSAAALHELPLLRSSPIAHITVGSLRRIPVAEGVVVRRSDVTAGDVVRVQDLPVTSVARTLRDLAPVAGLAELVCLIDAALGSRLLLAPADQAGLAGAPRLRRAHALADRGAQSCFESLSRLGMVLTGFGPVQTQLRLPGGPHPFDLGLPWCRRVFECDSREHHGPGAYGGAPGPDTVFERDRRQSNLVLREPGWGIGRLLWEHVWPSPVPLWYEVHGAVLSASGARVRELRRGPTTPSTAVAARLRTAWQLPGADSGMAVERAAAA